MRVNQHTKIGALLRQHPEALDSIVSINPKFEKLRNPILRKLMAGRVSIGMAAKIAGCTQEDFFGALRPLGFIPETDNQRTETTTKQIPAFIQTVKPEQVVQLDVRPILEAGNDPLKEIMAKVKALHPGEVLKIINTFAPTPLIAMLKKKGFQSWTDSVKPHLFETWFFRESATAKPEISLSPAGNEDWEQVKERFDGQLREMDVRDLEMPQPMMAILESLETLPPKNALFVAHKRMPVFLLPELAERGFDYRSRQLSDNEVHLLIFRN